MAFTLILCSCSASGSTQDTSFSAITHTSESPQLADDLLTDAFVRNELRSRIREGFYDAPAALEFFGDVGPLRACDFLNRTLGELTEAGLADFALSYRAAVNRAVPSERLAYTHPMQRRDLLSKNFRTQIDAELNLSDVQSASTELVERARSWAQNQDYTGKRLGYNRAGKSFWAANSATPQLVCATPEGSRANVVEGWQDEASDARL